MSGKVTEWMKYQKEIHSETVMMLVSERPRDGEKERMLEKRELQSDIDIEQMADFSEKEIQDWDRDRQKQRQKATEQRLAFSIHSSHCHLDKNMWAQKNFLKNKKKVSLRWEHVLEEFSESFNR